MVLNRNREGLEIYRLGLGSYIYGFVAVPTRAMRRPIYYIGYRLYTVRMKAGGDCNQTYIIISTYLR
jgi:hypothetical protein